MIAGSVLRERDMRKTKKRLNENFIDRPIAHRGLHSDTVCENSMEAFRLAIEKGYPIEIDVHLTKDGDLAVIHDSLLSRMTGKGGIVESLTSGQLKEYRLKDGQHIPMLREVLELVDGRVPLLIEIKFRRAFNEKQGEVLLEQLESYPYKDMVAMQSFHPKIVRWLKAHSKDYAVGYLSSYNLLKNHRFISYVLRTLKLFKWYMHADFISYDIAYLPNRYVTKQRKHGVQVLAWTVNTPERVSKAVNFADNIIFESLLSNFTSKA